MDARPHRYIDPVEGFWSLVDKKGPDECWMWLGVVQPNGYGQFKGLAHRWAYEQFVGPLYEGCVIRHSCDEPLCVNPDHLLIGSQADNVADRVARGRSARGPRNKRRGRSKK